MRYVLNFYNQVAAGPVTLTKTFLDILLSREKDNDNEYIIILPTISPYKDMNLKQRKKENTRILFIPYPKGIGKFFFLFLYDFVVFPLLILLFLPRAVLVFGNFAPIPLISQKAVLIHHPHLVEDELFMSLELGTRFVESVKRIIFSFTARTSKTIIVETDYMKEKVAEKYNVSKKKILVIKNPISKTLYEQSRKLLEEKNNILHRERKSVLYVSRYAPHKNYDFFRCSKKVFQ